MRILAIESSCDETAAAVVEDGRKILSSVVATQIDIHKLYGGVVPEIASRQHIEAISTVVENALKEANINLNQIDAIAVTAAPGLIGALLVGVNFAKGLAFSSGLPLIPVHHIRGHIASNYLEYSDLQPPFLALVVSGGHSNIIKVKDYTDFEILGRTRDDAAGECFDKAARVMGFPYPGGKHIDQAAKNGNPKAFAFPKTKFADAPYDFSFSGLKTAVINTCHGFTQKGMALPIDDIAASLQKAICDVLTDKLMLAALATGYKKIVLAGGVSANDGLRTNVENACKKEGYELYLPPKKLCGDNAAMIASQAYYEYISGVTANMSLNASATAPIDKGIEV